MNILAVLLLCEGSGAKLRGWRGAYCAWASTANEEIRCSFQPTLQRHFVSAQISAGLAFITVLHFYSVFLFNFTLFYYLHRQQFNGCFRSLPPPGLTDVRKGYQDFWSNFLQATMKLKFSDKGTRDTGMARLFTHHSCTGRYCWGAY